MQILICCILNNIRFDVLHAIPKVSAKDKLGKIINVMCIEKGRKTALAGDFNKQGEDFCQRIKNLQILNCS